MPGFSTRTVTLSSFGPLRIIALATLGAVVGCQTPYGQDEDTARLQAAIQQAIARETDHLESEPTLESPPTLDSEVERALAPRRAELEKLGPQPPRAGLRLDLGEDLLGHPQREVALGLRAAITTAVENNLSAQSARLGQGISETDVVWAQAAFDAVLFSDFQYIRLNQPQVVPFSDQTPIGLTPLGTPTRDTKQWEINTGLRNRLITGGAIEISTSINYDDIADSPGIEFVPDPAWGTAVSLGMTQPLLRGFGSDVALSEIRLARNAARASTEDLRAQLLSVIAEVERAYWDLVLARQQLAAAQWLLDVGVEVRDILSRRRGLDVTDANYADAVATVERRKGDLILAQRNIRAASDVLKALVNDPELPVGEETLVVPSDWMTDQPMRYDLREAIAVGIDRAPMVRRSLLSIDDASIGVVVADNGRLPQLDLEGQMRWNGLDTGLGSSFGELTSGDFVDYIVGLQFEQAIGNRAAEAYYRQARLRRSAAVVAYQQAIQETVLLVKNALRDVRSNFMLVGQYRALRLAQAENLRALLVDERTKGALTPEFLALKFQRQDGLASAQVREVKALVDYNTAIAQLFRSMGIGLQMNRIELRIDDTSAPLQSASRPGALGGSS